jgi:hypothetical protein
MKLKNIIALIVCAVGLLAPQLTGAQGVMTYLDNTGQPVAGSLDLGISYGSIGTQFQTGTNEAGYVLNSLQLLFADATGSPSFSGFNIVVCADNSGGPGSIITFFATGQNPLTAGFYNYTPLTIATLGSNTPYWVIVYNTSGNFNSAYNLSYTSTTAATAVDGWFIPGNTAIGQAGILIFAINATPVPEPSIFALLVMALAITSHMASPRFCGLSR